MDVEKAGTAQDTTPSSSKAAADPPPGLQPASPGLFRQEALDHLDVRAALEPVLRVTSARLWLALGACALAVAAALVWAFAGAAATTISGAGVLLPPDGVLQVPSPVSGTIVTTLPVGVNVVGGAPVATLRTSEGRTMSVPAPLKGLVDQLYVSPGTFVGANTPILEMLPAQPPAALVFVSAAQGKIIQNGMKANVSPTTAPAAQYGSIEGVVTYVSPLSLTSLRISSLVGARPGLAAAIEAGGPSLEVVISLSRDAANPTGYRWTSGNGPPFKITPGTLLSGSVTISTQRPASLGFSNS